MLHYEIIFLIGFACRVQVTVSIKRDGAVLSLYKKNCSRDWF